MKRIVWLAAVAGFSMIYFEMKGFHEIEAGWWLKIPGFFIIFGFLGCLLLLIVAKVLGRAGLLQDEDYYERS
ncbi:MAG: hypothetical protein DRJ11_02595 [Candidatus Aminicenantes bacterium]|nr:hypothetical protein [Candidatus Aminicenantes bacterium]RLE03968.1 MAG: hypothetical protein DRJ11_02595 [Candidatus Aminicenantes bacterium]